MFEYIKGTLIEIQPHKAVIDVNGVGYLLHISLNSFSKSPQIGKEALFYISTIIREDSHRNFGFLTIEERNFFEKISDISGIGPKTALAIVGHVDINNLETAIKTANVTLLSKIPGIGKKTAERLIIEMRDKIFKNLKKTPINCNNEKMHNTDQLVSDALSALLNLGYNSIQAQQAINKALLRFKNPPHIGELLKAALSGI